MKKRTCFILILVLLLIWMSGCSADSEAAADPMNTDPAVTEPPVTDPPIPGINHLDLGLDDQYTIPGGDTLFSYYEEPIGSFIGVCKYYEELDWTLYGFHILNNNQFATYTNGNELAHIYWIACEQELNVVTSSTGGTSLPTMDPGLVNESGNTTMTQLQSPRNNGMGYVIKLADGSFLIVDGGYGSSATELWSALVDLNGSEENIFIRAWLLTHSHKDHYECFSSFASRYASNVTLETLMISPLSKEHSKNQYLTKKVSKDISKFSGADILYVHTGMVFNFGDTTLEILLTPDEFLISEPTQDKFYTENLDFNSSSIISRIYNNDCRVIFLADCTEETALRLLLYYGDYLRSEMCQVSHHGVEDCPLIVYRFINASTYWYPCNLELFDAEGRYSDIRKAIVSSKSTKEIILHDQGRITRSLHANNDDWLTCACSSALPFGEEQ